MTRDKPVFPLAGMARVLRSIGPAIRVSDKAKIAFELRVRAYAEEVGRKAIDLARHAGRRTVKDRDIEVAGKALADQ